MPEPEPTGEGADAASDKPPPPMRERVANSSLWSLLLGGRPLPLRDAEELPALDVTRMPDGRGLRVAGDLDVLSVLQLEEALADADLPVPLVLDLAGVTFMDGVGTSLLLRLARMRGAEKTLVLLNPSRSVRRILEIAVPDGEPGLDVQFD